MIDGVRAKLMITLRYRCIGCGVKALTAFFVRLVQCRMRDDTMYSSTPNSRDMHSTDGNHDEAEVARD
jgi:hypothetical protein